MKKLTSPHVWPVIAVLMMFVMGIAVWTVMMVSGSKPVSVRNIGLEDARGTPKTAFTPGEVVAVRREVCSTKPLAVEFFPSLRSASGALMALGHGASYLAAECRETVFMFILPEQVPAGRYQYGNLIKYQSNLIGRDEDKVYPPLELEVVDG